MIAALATLAMAAAPATDDVAKNLAALQSMYEQSCQVRAYGSYDDLCNGIRKQLKEAERAAKKARAAERDHPVAQAKPPEPAAAPANLETAAKSGS